MTIEKITNASELTLKLTGRLDTITAPELETCIDESIDNVNDLTLDFAGMEYISSSGLRVLLKTQKIMNSKGSMKLVNVNEEIMEIFEITGFSDILTIV